MFPLRDEIPSERFPFVVIGLILINLAVFALQFSAGEAGNEALIQEFALVPARDFISPFAAESLFSWSSPYLSSMFMHGGVFHIFANLWSFWIFGDNVEGRMGHLRFLAFYLLCGLAAAITHSVLYPESTLPVVGASGAISGVMGAYLFLFPRAKLRMFTILIFYPILFDMPAVVFLVFWFLGQLMSGTADLAAQQASGLQDVGGVAFFAHIGGFVAGIALLPLLKGASPRRRLPR